MEKRIELATCLTMSIPVNAHYFINTDLRWLCIALRPKIEDNIYD